MGEGAGVGCGVALGEGVGLGEGVAVGVGVAPGDADGEATGVATGRDIGDKGSGAAILDAEGERIERVRVRTTGAGFTKSFSGVEGCRPVLEVGTHSPWVSRLLRASLLLRSP